MSPSQNDIHQAVDEIPVLSRTESIGEDDKMSKAGVEESRASASAVSREHVPQMRPPVVWSQGWGTFKQTLGDRLKSVFSRRLVLSLLVRRMVRYSERDGGLIGIYVGRPIGLLVHYMHICCIYSTRSEGLQCTDYTDLLPVST